MARSCHWLGVKCKQLYEHNVLQFRDGDLTETWEILYILFIANTDGCRLANIEGVSKVLIYFLIPFVFNKYGREN